MIALVVSGTGLLATAAAAEELPPTPGATATEESAPESAQEPAPSEPAQSDASEPAPTPSVMPAEPTETVAPPPRSDYLVTFSGGSTLFQRDAALDAAEATRVSAIPALRVYAVSLTADGVDTLRANTSVLSVEADRVREAQGVPNDPAYDDQWALPQIGWDSAYGAVEPSGSATVAVLDTGVDPTDDLSGRLLDGASFVDGVEGTADGNGHGTQMASLVAAGTDNGVGIAGVGYAGVSVLPVKVLGADGTGQDSDIVEGVVYAADKGADVILMSFSNPGRSSALQAAVDYAWSKGAVLVAATGNDGSSVATYPAGLAKVVGVSATNRSDELWTGSNYGDDTFLAAPGVDVATGSGSVSGTSASAAIVAGAAALVAADSTVGPGVVVGRLARNADVAGTTEQTGNGRVNLARALSDTSTDPVVPQGVAGDGGLFVGPYVAGAATELSGTVYGDTNANGVLDGGEVGRAGVSVVLWLDRNGNGTVEPSNAPGTDYPPLLTSVTSATGQYAFTSGFSNNTRYLVEVRSAGLQASAATACTIGGSGNNPASTSTITSGTLVNLVFFGNSSPTCTNGRFLVKSTNTPPVATVSLAPATPTTDQTLTATATKFDADGNPVALTYVWKVNGTTVKTTAGSNSLSDSLDLSGFGNGNRGDTVRVEVTPSDGTSSGQQVSDQVEVGNTAPTLTSVTITPAAPGTQSVLTATPNGFADADDDSATYHFQWFKNGTALTGETGSTLDLGVSGNGNRDDVIKVEVSATDGNGGSSPTREDQVEVGNTAPTLTLVGPDAANEGDTKEYSFTVSDLDIETFVLVGATCGGGTKSDQMFDAATGAGSFKCAFADGPRSHEVSVQVKDSDDAADSDSVTVEVANVAPVVDSLTLTGVDPVTGLGTLTATFTDPGSLDTFVGSSFAVTHVGGSVSPTGLSIAGRTMTATVKLPSGCRSYVVTATVIDKDGASGGRTLEVSQTDIYQASFRDPIRDNERNVAKFGNVVPVKVQLSSSCSGAAVTSPILHLTLVQGNVSDDTTDDTPNLVAESVSNADSGTQMRTAGGMHVFNLSTKSMKVGTQYTVRIRSGSTQGPIILKALLETKK